MIDKRLINKDTILTGPERDRVRTGPGLTGLCNYWGCDTDAAHLPPCLNALITNAKLIKIYPTGCENKACNSQDRSINNLKEIKQ